MSEPQGESRIKDVEQEDDLMVVTVEGDIDLQHSVRFQQEALELLGRGPRRIILDLSGVSYMDSSGLASLVKVQSRCRKENLELRLAGLNPRVQGLLEITRLASVFEIFPSVKEARN
jgi:anti-sigma B factor antagonist